MPDFDADSQVIGLYTVTIDVHELTVTQEKLKRRIEHDTLTDVLSRRTMMAKRFGKNRVLHCAVIPFETTR